MLIDDMIIIVDTFDRVIQNAGVDIHNNRNDNKIKELMGIALSESGLSITLTSLSSTVAFSIGSAVFHINHQSKKKIGKLK